MDVSLVNNWTQDLKKSSKAFIDVVWPNIKTIAGEGMIVPVESVTAQGFTKQLDMLAGIDFWQVLDNGMRGIANRVQFGDISWNSFTIRTKRATDSQTEYEKRKNAIYGQRGLLYPHLTIQSYVAKKPITFLSAGIIKTKDLFDYIECGGKFTERINRVDNNKFIAIYWKNLQGKIKIIDRSVN